jgi:hypothetical protein
MNQVPIAYAVPVAEVSVAVPVLQVQELSEKEWLQKYHPGKYDFKEEDMKSFPGYVKDYIRTWTKVEDSYLFFKPALPLDEANTKAAAVFDVRGSDAAIQYMMSSANGSYSQMRMMYG